MFASAFLLAFFTWVQIDLLLVFCVVLATSGLVSVAHGKQTGWLMTGIALGLGLLAKGPVVLLHVLPLALLAPVWKSEPPGSGWWRWYAGVLVSVCIAASIALAWALPATGAGGETYREAIFWGQTAERLVRSFAHTNPLWWYLPWLFVLFAPWICLPWLWSAVRSAWTNRDEGMRFCVTWLLTVLVLLSLVSGKQVKYLLPLLPAFALLVSRLLLQMQAQSTEQRPWLLAALLLVMGLIGVLAPGLLEQAPWLNTVHPAWGGSLIVCAAVLLWLRPAVPLQYPVRMAVLTVFVICIGELGVLRVGVPSHDLRAASRFVARAQAAGHPVAVQAHYHGEFAFYGRLQQPVVQLASGAAADWAAQHPDDYLVLTGHDLAGQYPDTAFIQPYRSGELAIIRGRALIPYNGASRASE
jgi:4-amino-4-deoxy-L-arabinose transferase-like glycosyltransferase